MAARGLFGRHRLLLAGASIVVALALPACSHSGALEGAVSISGSSTAQPLASRIAGRFAADHPHARISIDGPGTGDGFLLLCDERIDIATASRRMNDREKALCKAGGVGWVEVPVALDAIVVTTGSGLTVPCLTLADLYALSGPEATNTASWKGAEALSHTLGSSSPLPDQRLEVVAPGAQSGTAAVYLDLVIRHFAEERQKSVALRSDHVSAETDQLVPPALLARPTALGILGFTAARPGEGLHPIAVDAGRGCVAPSTNAVSAGTYPLERTLYIYVNTSRARANATLRGFVDTALSDKAAVLAREAGSVPLSPAARGRARKAWTKR